RCACRYSSSLVFSLPRLADARAVLDFELPVVFEPELRAVFEPELGVAFELVRDDWLLAADAFPPAELRLRWDVDCERCIPPCLRPPCSPLPPSPLVSLSSPISFLATPTAAGTAIPTAAPAAIFFFVDMPS